MRTGNKFIDDVIAKQADEQKRAVAWWSGFVWIVSGIYLFATTPGAHFFSFSALIFFTIGIFAACVVLGIIGYVVQRSLAWAFTNTIGMPGPKAASMLSLLGLGLFVAQTVIVYLAARQFRLFDRVTVWLPIATHCGG